MNRRNFLRLGSLFVPAVVAPTVAYSFLWARPESWLDDYAMKWAIAPRFMFESDDALRARILEHLQPPRLAPANATRRAIVALGEKQHELAGRYGVLAMPTEARFVSAGRIEIR